MQSNYSNTVSGNASYPLQPPVKRKTNPMGKRNFFLVDDSHIERVERDLNVHHLSEKNISLKCKKFEGADIRRIQHHLLPSLHEDQIDNIIIHGGTNDISQNKLHTTRLHDLVRIFLILIMFVNHLVLQKLQFPQFCLAKDLCGFYGFSKLFAS